MIINKAQTNITNSIDTQKQSVDFRLVGIDRTYYSIVWNNEKPNEIIKGKRNFDKFSKDKTWTTDF